MWIVWVNTRWVAAQLSLLKKQAVHLMTAQHARVAYLPAFLMNVLSKTQTYLMKAQHARVAYLPAFLMNVLSNTQCIFVMSTFFNISLATLFEYTWPSCNTFLNQLPILPQPATSIAFFNHFFFVTFPLSHKLQR